MRFNLFKLYLLFSLLLGQSTTQAQCDVGKQQQNLVIPQTSLSHLSAGLVDRSSNLAESVSFGYNKFRSYVSLDLGKNNYHKTGSDEKQETPSSSHSESSESSQSNSSPVTSTPSSTVGKTAEGGGSDDGDDGDDGDRKKTPIRKDTCELGALKVDLLKINEAKVKAMADLLKALESLGDDEENMKKATEDYLSYDLSRHIDDVDIDGQSLLHFAIKKGLVDYLRYLLIDKKADTNVVNQSGETPLNLAVSYTESEFDFTSFVDSYDKGCISDSDLDSSCSSESSSDSDSSCSSESSSDSDSSCSSESSSDSDSESSLDSSDDESDDSVRFQMIRLLVSAGVKIHTQYVTEYDSPLAFEQLKDNEEDEKAGEILEYLHEIQRQTHLKVLQKLWNGLSSEAQHQSILDLYAICSSLNLDPLDFQLEAPEGSISQSPIAIPEIDQDLIRKHTLDIDPEFYLSEFFLRILERQINESNMASQAPFTVVQFSAYQLIEFFRNLSLSAVDTTAKPTLEGCSRGFVSFSKEQGSSEPSYRLIRHRLPYTVCACICKSPSSKKDSSGEKSQESTKCKVYIGRSASRNPTAGECHARSASASPKQLDSQRDICSRYGGSPVSRSPVNCAEFPAMTRVDKDIATSGSPQLVVHVDAVVIGNCVCKYHFKDLSSGKRFCSEKASPTSKSPCLNCQHMYPDAFYQGQPIAKSLFPSPEQEGTIINFRSLGGSGDEQIIGQIEVQGEGGCQYSAECRIPKNRQDDVEKGKKIRFRLTTSEKSGNFMEVL